MALIDEARELIKVYLQKNTHLSIAGMARSAGLPASTARSIIQGEVKKTSQDNITSLLRTFMAASDVVELLRRHGDEEIWTEVQEIYAAKEAIAVAGGVHEWEYPDHEIAARASSSFGVGRAHIKQAYGERGLERLDTMLNAGILREVNGRIRQPGDYVEYTIPDSIRKARLQAESFKKDDLDKGGFCYHVTLNCSAEGHKKGRDIARKFLADINQVERDFPGGETVLMLSLLANMLGGEGENQ